VKTELLFPTPLWIEEECGVDRDKLKQFISLVRQEDPEGRVATNYGGWQSHDFIDSVMLNNPLREIRDKILQIAYLACDEWGFQDYTLKITNLWLNVNGKGHYNNLHTHAGSVLSGVYYVDVPSCCSGHINFHNRFEDMMLKESWGCDANFNKYQNEHYNRTDYFMDPKDDMMILFPSWLQHSVSKSASDDDRISLSFNIIPFSNYYREIYPSR